MPSRKPTNARIAAATTSATPATAAKAKAKTRRPTDPARLAFNERRKCQPWVDLGIPLLRAKTLVRNGITTEERARKLGPDYIDRLIESRSVKAYLFGALDMFPTPPWLKTLRQVNDTSLLDEVKRRNLTLEKVE